MANELTIGELSARSGVAPSALRFYERRGLIDATRTDGNQRRYERSTLRRLSLSVRRCSSSWLERRWASRRAF